MKYARPLALLAFLAVAVSSYLGPIVEGDLFWHLSEGRAIAKGERAIPLGEFPTQWLGQVALFRVQEAFGYPGIVLLRALVYGGILLGLVLWCWRGGRTGLFTALLFALFPARMLIEFPSERPQLFSFALFPLTVWLLDRFAVTRKPSYALAIPPVLVLWGNVHAGVLMGVGAVLIYLGADIVSALRGRVPHRSTLLFAGCALVPLLAAVLANPSVLATAAGTVRAIVVPNEYVATVQEYLSPFRAARETGFLYPAYWGFGALALYTLIAARGRMPLVHGLMLGAFSALSLTALRFTPYPLLLVPFVAEAWSEKNESRESRAMGAALGVVLALWVALTPPAVRLDVSEDFPRDGMKFVRSFLSTEVIFNYQAWSGYLAWELEGKKVFLPTEGAATDLDDAYEKILWADSTPLMGKPQWRALMDTYGIDAVLVPGVSPASGVGIPLVEALALSRDWSLLHADDVTVVFVKNTPRNAAAIGLYSSPKGNAYLGVIEQADRMLQKEPKKKALWLTLGDAYLRLGRQEEAEKAFARGRGE